MSKAGWFGLLFLGAGFGLTVFLVTMGLSDDARQKAKDVEEFLASAAENIASEEARFDALVKEHAEYLNPTNAVPSIRGDFQRYRATLGSIEATELATLKAYLQKDSPSDDQAVLNLCTRIQMRITDELKGFTSARERLEHIISYKTEYPKIVKDAEARVAALPKNLDGDTTLNDAANTAKQKATYAQAKVDQRLQTLTGFLTKAPVDLAKMQELAAIKPPQFYEIGVAADRAMSTADEFERLRKSTLEELPDFPVGMEIILVDMSKEDEQCTHTHRTVRVEQVATPPGRESAEKPKLTDATEIKNVPCTLFKQQEKNLGMTISSKPAGAFYDEFQRVASPPGYAYVGNPQYGEWRRSGGQSFWVFYGQYALMRDLFWGRGQYRNYRVSRRGWSNYRNSVRSGRSYYGNSKQYGTSGRHTRSQYSSSRYFRSRAGSGSSGGGGSRRSGGSGYRGSSYGGGGK